MGAAKLQIKTAALTIAILIFGLNASALPVFSDPSQITSKKKQKCETDPHSLKGLIENINIFETDKRVVQERDGGGKVFAPIGGLESNASVTVKDPATQQMVSGKVRGTAFLVSPCYIATNYHAVFGLTSSPNKDSFSNTFYSFQGGGKALSKTVAHPVAWGDYGKSKNVDDDWTLLKLDTCVGEQIGWMEFGSMSSDHPTENFLSAGYPGDKRATALWIDPACKILQPSPTGSNTWENNCALRSGGSGSPVMYLSKDGSPRVIAMQSSDRNGVDGILPKYDQTHANLAVDVAGALRKEMATIRTDRERIGINPALPADAVASASL